MGKIVVCGDSFSIGIGCHDLYNEPYGSLLSKELDKELINLAKGSSTNFSIFLQVKYAVENIDNIDLLIVGTTCFHRTEWFPENVDDHHPLDNRNVNYHDYPPYGEMTYPYLLENPMKNDSNYRGELLTENYHGIIDYVDGVLDKNLTGIKYFNKFKNEPDEKLRLLKQYYLYFYDGRIQMQYDMGMITMGHILLKNKGIKHIVLTPYVNEFSKYIDKNDLLDVDWGILSNEYPDDLKSLHTSYEGHKIVFEKIKNKLKSNLI